MLLSRQIKRADDRSQAQERVLVKVVQQNQETLQTIQRVENSLALVSKALKDGFISLGQELSKVSTESLEEVKELWNKKVCDLERAIQIGGETSTKQIEKDMKKLEALLAAKLLDLDIGADRITQELKQLRRELISSNESRLLGDAQAETTMIAILTDLKSLQLQLTRVEHVTTRIFRGMECGFADLRKELASNFEGLNEFKDMWMKKMMDLEKTLIETPTIEAFEKQMKKIEALVNAKLLDLDASTITLSPQLLDMKQQLKDALVSYQAGQEKSDIKMKEVISELKSLQTQLSDVIHLQKENMQILNQVSVTFPTSP